jgi:FAD/FMN-containing dehydrogenase
MPAMKKRDFLRTMGSAAAAFIPLQTALAAPAAWRRVRPGDAAWPSPRAWDTLRKQVGGRLAPVRSPLAACAVAGSVDGAAVFESLKNPYYIRDQAGLTQAMGWSGAWVSQPSRYVVECTSAADVAAAVRFARKHKLRLVVKGGGHSYQGTSSAPDSLLVWTRRMDKIVMHEAFVPAGCGATHAPQAAVTVDAGAIWMHTYNAVTTKGGRYVQGGGCATVGVAGLIQSGGFGSHSKRYGLASASLLEAEIVTADGVLRTVNACREPELFWAIKGGGGGSFGVVTRVTLRTHELPAFFGVVALEIEAASDAAYRRLIARLVAFYAEHLFNPHWGEQMVFKTQNKVGINMLFQGLDLQQAKALWRPLFEALAAAPEDYRLKGEPLVAALPARAMWDPAVLKTFPGAVTQDARPGASPDDIYWSGNEKEAGKFINGYESAWVPASLLAPGQQARLVDALFASTRRAEMALHFNKGLAGAPPEAIAAARDTAINPAVLDACALAICAGEQLRRHPLIAGHAPDARAAREDAADIAAAMAALRTVIPAPGSYVSESNYFEPDWQRSFWGGNYTRLLAVKRKFDPEGLFIVRHGVGSEGWSDDGFVRKA